MENALYPHPVDGSCPYCGSGHVRRIHCETNHNMNYESKEVVCLCCNKKHFLRYQLCEITLQGDQSPPQYRDYHVGHEIHDADADIGIGSGKKLVAAVVKHDGIYLMAHGYGDGATINGHGCPVIVEVLNEEFRMAYWPDINNDDAAHAISLEGAAISNFKPIEDFRYELVIMTPGGEAVESHHFDSEDEALNFENFFLPVNHHYIVIDRMKNNEIIKSSRD